MEETKLFALLLSKDPKPGTKNRIIKNDRIYYLPGWIFDSEEEIVVVKYKSLNRAIIKAGYTPQIVFDILQLGLTDISQRPVCQICGKPVKFFKIYTGGYLKTCSDPNCKSELSRKEVTKLWENQDYRNTQVNSHKEWASKEENLEQMRQISLRTWKDQNYRDKQVASHKEWSNKEENKLILSKRSSSAWQNEEYRKHQSEIHKEFAKNNPEKVRAGQGGNVLSKKSLKGQLRYDSSWEKEFVELLDDIEEVISVERAEFSIPYTIGKEVHNYFPDLVIEFNDKRKFLVEIKANWMIKYDIKTPEKIKAGKKYVEDNNSIFYGYILLKDENLCDGPHYVKFNRELARKELFKLIT
jgi:hypothetical protein